jgi:hypothetical protein
MIGWIAYKNPKSLMWIPDSRPNLLADPFTMVVVRMKDRAKES